jgi:hypothetical protein
MKLKLHGMAGLLLSITGSCALFQSAQAQFVDNNRDLLLTFRKIQPGDVGSVDLVVDIGQASIYYGATPGSSIPITQYSVSQLNAVLPDPFLGTDNNLGWSVAGCVSEFGDNGDPSKPSRTLWLTAPRSNPGAQAQPWERASIFQQGPTALKVETMLENAQTWALSVSSDSVTNTRTAGAISTGSQYCPNGPLTSLGNFDTFQGDVENTTSGAFSFLGTPAVSDFYELQPGSGTGTYLGYFQFGTDETLTFYASQGVIYPAPTLSVSNDNAGHALVSFKSTVNGTYTLHYTSAAGLTTPVSSWSTATPAITGDGTVKTFQQPISGTATFYSVSVH